MGTRVRTHGLKGGGGGLRKQGKEQLQQRRLAWEAPPGWVDREVVGCQGLT